MVGSAFRRRPEVLMTLAAGAWAVMWLPMAWGMGPGQELRYITGLLAVTLAADALSLLCLGPARIYALLPALTDQTPWRWVYGLFTLQFGLLPYASRLLDPAVVAALIATYPVWFVLAGAMIYRGLSAPALRWGRLSILLALGVSGGALSMLSMSGLSWDGGESDVLRVASGLGVTALSLALMPGVLVMGRLAAVWSNQTGMSQYWCWVAGRIPVIAVSLLVAALLSLMWGDDGFGRALVAGALAGLCNWAACWAFVAGLTSGRGVGAQVALCLESPLAALLLAATGLGGEGVDWLLLGPGLALAVVGAAGAGSVSGAASR